MCIKWLALFFLINNTQIKIGNDGGYISTWRISICFFVVIFLYKSQMKMRYLFENRRVFILWLFNIGLAGFSFIWVLWRGSITGYRESTYHQPTTTLIYAFMALVCPYIVVYAFDRLEELMGALVFAGLFQAIFCLCEFFIIPFKYWLEDHINATGNLNFLTMSRAIGLGGEGAALSVRMSFSILACCYFIYQNQHKIISWLIIVLILVADLFIGRTGLYIGLIYIFLLILHLVKNPNNLRNCIIIGITAMGVLFTVLLLLGDKDNIGFLSMDARLGEVYSRNTDFANRIFGENGFFGAYFSWKYPPISKNSLLGYGAVRDILISGQLYGGDKGYLQRVLSEGYILAIIEYICLLLYFLEIRASIVSKCYRKMATILILFLFLLELKEVFIYNSSFILIMTMILLKSRTEINTKEGVI